MRFKMRSANSPAASSQSGASVVCPVRCMSRNHARTGWFAGSSRSRTAEFAPPESAKMVCSATSRRCSVCRYFSAACARLSVRGGAGAPSAADCPALEAEPRAAFAAACAAK